MSFAEICLTVNRWFIIFEKKSKIYEAFFYWEVCVDKSIPRHKDIACPFSGLKIGSHTKC